MKNDFLEITPKELKRKYEIITEIEGIGFIPTRLKILIPDNDPLLKKCKNSGYSIKILCDAILKKQKNLDWQEYEIEENIQHRKGDYIIHVCYSNF